MQLRSRMTKRLSVGIAALSDDVCELPSPNVAVAGPAQYSAVITPAHLPIRRDVLGLPAPPDGGQRMNDGICSTRRVRMAPWRYLGGKHGWAHGDGRIPAGALERRPDHWCAQAWIYLVSTQYAS